MIQLLLLSTSGIPCKLIKPTVLRPSATLTSPVFHTIRRLKVKAGKPETDTPELADAIVHVRGDTAYDSVKEYILLPRNLTIPDSSANPCDVQGSSALSASIHGAKLASLFVKRNVIFGARSHQPNLKLITACSPLLDAALTSASEFGDQPQALASLFGLSSWVRSCLTSLETNGNETQSEVLNQMSQDRSVEGIITFQAIQAIATQQPRSGRKKLGLGTYRDGRLGWEALCKEYANRVGNDGEPALYRKFGGEVVCVEYLADTSPDYVKEAGGAVVRFFFL